MARPTDGGKHHHTELPIICGCEFPIVDALTFRCRRCAGLVPYHTRMRLLQEYEATMNRLIRCLAFTVAALGSGLLVAQLVRALLGR
jgi:predicted amidophosphoribosyltransferase